MEISSLVRRLTSRLAAVFRPTAPDVPVTAAAPFDHAAEPAVYRPDDEPAPEQTGGERTEPTWRPDHTFQSLADVDTAALDGKNFTIELDGLLYACDLALLPGADRLYVSLHAYADRITQHPPFFWTVLLNDTGHVLRISDPTLFLNEQLTVSGFLGREEQDPVEGVVAIARHLAARLGLGEDRIIFWGTSGGGFAALKAAAMLPRGRAVGINSQLVTEAPERFPWAHVTREMFRKGISYAEIRAAYPARASVAEALKQALARGDAPRFVLAQNIADDICYADHFVPFCGELGLDPAQSERTANVRTFVFHQRRGHGVVPPSISRMITREGVPFLFGEE